MKRVCTFLLLFAGYLGLYILFAGSTTITDLVFGAIVSCIASLATMSLCIERYSRVLDLRRFLYLATYLLYYMLIVEPRAHLDVVKRILSPRYRPAIVAIPTKVRSSYALLTVANSITNTPGTVVVDVDEERGVLYVHWIDAKTFDPEKAREYVSRVFEDWASKIFD